MGCAPVDGCRHFRLLDAGADCLSQIAATEFFRRMRVEVDGPATQRARRYAFQPAGAPPSITEGFPYLSPGFSCLFLVSFGRIFPLKKGKQKSAGYKRILRFCAYLCSFVPVLTRHFNGSLAGFETEGDTYFSRGKRIAAWAAASRAMGTRKGEQDT